MTGKSVLGGESSCSTSVPESVVVDWCLSVVFVGEGGLTMPTPDEADVGAGGKVVAESGWCSVCSVWIL